MPRGNWLSLLHPGCPRNRVNYTLGRIENQSAKAQHSSSATNPVGRRPGGRTNTWCY